MERAVAMSDLLTRREAAEYLRISSVTLGRWSSLQNARLPSVQVGSRVMYRRADLEAFLEKNRRECPA